MIFHILYKSRPGVDATEVKEALGELLQKANESNLALLFSLRHDFPTEWSAFVSGNGNFTATIRKDYFPYMTQGKPIKIEDLCGLDEKKHLLKHNTFGDPEYAASVTDDLGNKDKQAFTISIPPEEQPGPTQVLTADAQAFLIVRYTLET